MAAQQATRKSSKGKGPDQEQIILQFNQMRQEQRNVMGKIGELDQELNEHSVVIDALKGIEPDRKCFRMIGGVLVERTVKDVLPALENNKQQLNVLIEKLNQQLVIKGQELNAFRDKYNIRIKGEKENTQQQNLTADKSTGVLVTEKEKS